MKKNKCQCQYYNSLAMMNTNKTLCNDEDEYQCKMENAQPSIDVNAMMKMNTNAR